MAFSRTRKRGGEQGKCVGGMGCEPASSLCSIVEVSLSNKRQNEIINRSHDFSHVARGHACGIFLESHIATVM